MFTFYASQAYEDRIMLLGFLFLALFLSWYFPAVEVINYVKMSYSGYNGATIFIRSTLPF